MVTICIGPVCVPLHLLLPFLVGLMHRRGWFKWFKQEWVTIRFWKTWWAGAPHKKAEAKAKPDVKQADAKVHETIASQPKETSNTSHSPNMSPDGVAGAVELPQTQPGIQHRNVQQQEIHASQ